MFITKDKPLFLISRHDISFMMADLTAAMNSGKRSSEKIFHGRKAQSHNAATTHSAILIHSVCATVAAIAMANRGISHCDSKNDMVNNRLRSRRSFTTIQPLRILSI